MFENKKLLITGGTGSFGNAVLRRFLDSDISEIRILSRDEKKQDDMRRKYANSRLKFYIGDVRDYNSIMKAVRGVDYIFHAAALKQVPSCEFYPIEAAKTNIFGTENVLTASIDAGVKRVICLSTDKAVYPVNAMGMSKAMMEKVLVAKSREGGDQTVICGTRYGNVMASRGSVIPLFVEQIRNQCPLTITDPDMTRFMMSLDDAVDLVLYAFEQGTPGDIFVQKSPAATILVLAQALCELLGMKIEPFYRIIGTRHGEKRYESLLSREEIAKAEDLGAHFRIPPDLRDLNYSKFFEQGEEKITISDEYNSDNTERLDVEGMKKLLMKLKFIQAALKGEYVDPEA
nr:polysaccharide biosynthesis protein [uncultured Desulfobacter sp.]